MRTLALLPILAMSVPTAWAGETQPSRRTVDERRLTKAAIEHYAAPYFPEIRACYASHGTSAKRRATGELSLRLVIHPDGSVTKLEIEAPGVTGIKFRMLTRCIRKSVEAWHFPVRRDFTSAVLPYYFVRLDLPSAGPQLSCWSAKGCPDQWRPRPGKKPVRRE